jgi:hypothetical protein
MIWFKFRAEGSQFTTGWAFCTYQTISSADLPWRDMAATHFLNKIAAASPSRATAVLCARFMIVRSVPTG